MFRERNSGRVRAGLRAVIPALVTLVLLIGWMQWLVPVAIPDRRAVTTAALGMGLGYLGYSFAVALALWIATRLDHRRVTDYGLVIDGNWIRDFAVGTAIGLVAFVVSVQYARLRGVAEVDTGALEVDSSAAAALVVGGLLLFVGFNLVQNVYEEVVYRGIMLQTLAEGLAERGRSPRTAVLGATALSCLAFGAFHLPLAGPAVAADAAVVGLSFALAYVLTGNLGLATGVHFGRTPLNVLVESGAEATTPFGLPPAIEFVGLTSDVEILRLAVTGLLLVAWAYHVTGRIGVSERVYRSTQSR